MRHYLDSYLVYCYVLDLYLLWLSELYMFIYDCLQFGFSTTLRSRTKHYHVYISHLSSVPLVIFSDICDINLSQGIANLVTLNANNSFDAIID